MDRPAPMRWRTARRLWPLLKDLSKGYKRKLFVATVLVLLGRAAALVPPASTRFLIDTILQHGRRDLLPKYVALVAASIAASALAGLTAERMFGSTAFALVAALRRRSQQHIAQLPVAFYDSTRAGTLTARIMSDPDALGRSLQTVYRRQCPPSAQRCFHCSSFCRSARGSPSWPPFPFWRSAGSHA